MAPGEDSADSAPLPPGERTRATRSAFFFPVRLGVFLWLLDVATLQRDQPRPVGATVVGAMVALCLTLCVTAAVGCVAAAGRWLARSPAWGRPSSRLVRTRRWLRGDQSPSERLRRAGLLLSLPILLAGYAGGSFLVGQRLIVSMARPELTALALLALHVALLALMLWLAPVAASIGSWVAWGLGRVPWLGARVFQCTWHFALWLGLGLASAVGVAIYMYREPLGYLPLREMGLAAGATLLTVVYGIVAARAPSRVRWAPRVLVGLAAVASVAIALSMTPTQMFARHIAEKALLSGRLSHAGFMLAFDVDRDGHLPMFGGGDCAPFDPRKNPGALDVPANGIDEDCDGSDLDPKSLPRFGIYDKPVPDTVPTRPPVVLITVDAFAARQMQSLGGEREVTPNLDALAKRSVLFTRCFTQGPSTRLSFPAIFTSRWDTQIRSKLVGKHPFPIDVTEKLLAEMMRDAGYDTSAVTSDGYFARSRWTGLLQGFEHVDESPFAKKPSMPHSGARVTDAAIEALESETHAPQFLWAHYYDAHSPHSKPEGAPDFGKSRADEYASELWFVDREIGRLLTRIDELFDGEALIIVTGDHGIAFDVPRHEKFNYGYDLSSIVLHVPLIIHAPFLQPRRIDGVVSTMDIVPTLANLLRLKGPFAFEGVSLVPELLDGKSERPPMLMHQMFLEERLWKNEDPLERVSLRTERFNLVHERKGGFFELYDYERDYLETNDLANDPAHAETLRELRKDLLLLVYEARPASAREKAPAKQASKKKAAP